MHSSHIYVYAGTLVPKAYLKAAVDQRNADLRLCEDVFSFAVKVFSCAEDTGLCCGCVVVTLLQDMQISGYTVS